MSDLDKFLNNDEIHIAELIRIAIAHYQFETIHPFLDGNGRIGRLLITLYLVSKNLLVKPALYLSDFFEKNKTLYYDNLMNVRLKHDLKQWLKFFLVGVVKTSQDSIQTFKDILLLKEKIENKQLVQLGKKFPKAKKFIFSLYKKPIINVRDIEIELKISKPSANALAKDLISLNILKEMTGFKRNRLFAFEPYIELFKK